jgi:hypothetical protein
LYHRNNLALFVSQEQFGFVCIIGTIWLCLCHKNNLA